MRSATGSERGSMILVYVFYACRVFARCCNRAAHGLRTDKGNINLLRRFYKGCLRVVEGVMVSRFAAKGL